MDGVGIDLDRNNFKLRSVCSSLRVQETFSISTKQSKISVPTKSWLKPGALLQVAI
ncbi:hypothetical protein SAMN05660330_00809 [Desulforhopalus singaporensis]|uniref:Uncharacterized protein n=1 Tax=Desulforhopalus singaporensis TaxID=91360 RepID=A0A1H0LI20_9BACT|nr:hypothetical protein SAMN05660330_00809 [Desulforhopalus singaporensis]